MYEIYTPSNKGTVPYNNNAEYESNVTYNNIIVK